MESKEIEKIFNNDNMEILSDNHYGLIKSDEEQVYVFNKILNEYCVIPYQAQTIVCALTDYERAYQQLKAELEPFKDDYFKDLSTKEIAELAKKSIRLTTYNLALEEKYLDIKEENEKLNKIIEDYFISVGLEFDTGTDKLNHKLVTEYITKQRLENTQLKQQLDAYKHDRFCQGGCTVYQFDKIKELKQQLEENSNKYNESREFLQNKINELLECCGEKELPIQTGWWTVKNNIKVKMKRLKDVEQRLEVAEKVNQLMIDFMTRECSCPIQFDSKCGKVDCKERVSSYFRHQSLSQMQKVGE